MKDKEAMYNTGVYLIAMSDEGMETKRLKAAIKELKRIIYLRENIPL